MQSAGFARIHAIPIAPHTLRRQVERFCRKYRRMAGSGAYGPRVWLEKDVTRPTNHKVLLSWELPAMFDIGDVMTVMPMESSVTEIDSEYNLGRARANFRSREAIGAMQATEQQMAYITAEVQKERAETDEQATDWLATGKQIKNTRTRKDFDEWDAGTDDEA